MTFLNWITFASKFFLHSFWHKWFTQGCLNQVYRWLYNRPELIHFNLITMKDIHEVSNCTFSTHLSGVLHWKNLFFVQCCISDLSDWCCLFDAIFFPEMGEKKLVDFCFLGVESSIEKSFQIFKINGVCFLSCYPLNHSQFIFRINLNNTSLVWPLITMIFDNNKVTNMQKFIRQKCTSLFVLLLFCSPTERDCSTGSQI